MSAEIKVIIEEGAGRPTPPPGSGAPPPPPSPAGGWSPAPVPSGGTSSVPALDRPSPVVVMGPRPLPVTMTGAGGGPKGKGAGKPPKPPKPQGTGWAGRFEAAGAAASAGAGAFAGIAAGKAMPALEAGVNVAARGLGALGPAGMAAGAALKAGAKAAEGFVETVQAFVARGRELSNLDGRIAGAAAQADVRKFMSDYNEAQKLGAQYAKLIDTTSRIESLLAELLVWAKGTLLTVLNEGIAVLGDTAVQVLVILEMATKLFGIKIPEIGELLTKILAALGGGGGDPAALLKAWLEAGKDFKAPGAVARPVGAGLGIPLVRP